MASRKSYQLREIKWGLFFAVLIGIGFALLLDNLHILGRNIPSSEIGADYFRGIFTVCILTPIIFLFPARSTEIVSLVMLWGIRSTITLGFMLYYEYTYGLDAYHYFAEAVSKVEFSHTFNQYDGTNNVIAIARFFAQNVPFLASYHALKVLWSFFGFVACFVFYKAYTRSTGKSDIKVLWLIGLFPSILFWSSILGKDPITFLGISLFFYGSLELFKRFSPLDVLIACTGLAMTGIIRVWLVVVFALPFLLLYLIRSNAKVASKAIIATCAAVLIGYFSTDILSATQISDSGSFLDTLNTVSRSWSRGGSGQSVQHFASTQQAITFLPQGIFTALFRPLPGEVNNLFGALSGLENLILLFGLMITFFMASPEAKKDRFLQYAAITIFCWSLFYAFISYQNLGTAVRFKLQVLPLLLLVPIRLLHYSKKKGST